MESKESGSAISSMGDDASANSVFELQAFQF